MKIIHNFLGIVGVLALLLIGCSKDMGNYTYQNLSDYFIDTTKLDRSIVIKQNETFTIDPALAPGVSAEGLTYEWRLMQTSFATNPATGTYFNAQIGKEKKITYRVVEEPGDYMLVLYAKNQTGLTQIVKTPFFISSYASVGLMVIHGDQTSSDISIVANTKLNAQLPAGTDFVQSNVFNETNGKKIDGEAANVIYMGQHWVDVFTKGSNGGYRLKGNDLRIIHDYSNMFVSPMPQSEIKFEAYGLWSYNELLINNGGLYFASQPSPNAYNPFGLQCFGQDYVAAPFLATIMHNSYYGVFYDSKNKRFLTIDFSRVVKGFKAPGAIAAFDMTNVGKEMVYAEHGYDNRWYCVMQDQDNPATREIFQVKLNVLDDGNRGIARNDIHLATELDKSKYFAFGNRGNIMYHATDTKIWQNNYDGDLSSTLRLDLAGSYPGYIISAMKVFKVTNHVNDGKIFYVALYNESTKEGKLLQIDINEVTGVFGTTKEYTGFGKIAGMNYKTK